MKKTTVNEVCRYLETLAPKAYQESYDNSGLITGDPNAEVTGVLVTLDCTEAVVSEAVSKGCNLIVAHHPIVFKGLKKLTGQNYIERTVIQAIRADVAIYAIHTNLDNVHNGVNRRIADIIGLQKVRVLLPKTDTLMKLVTFVPQESAQVVLDALYKAGAGQIGKYSNCSFSITGTGSFLPDADANPTIGEPLKQEFVTEARVEVILPSHLKNVVWNALRSAHPYEEIAHYFSILNNENQEVGSGMVGELPEPMEPMEFLKRLKSQMNLRVIKHTAVLEGPVRKVALCGGSGSFLLPQAIQSGAQVYISADFKYHEFFDADGRIMIADIGHYESEIYTKALLQEVLTKKFPNFAINFSSTVTNPISYF